MTLFDAALTQYTDSLRLLEENFYLNGFLLLQNIWNA